MLDLHQKRSYMGEMGFVWWHGIIVDIQDPLQAGRVRVRCYGYHPETDQVGNDDLPWALVMLPTTGAGISGIGHTPHGLVPGTQVVGFFRDGQEAQHPVVMGVIAGIPPETNNDTEILPGESDESLSKQTLFKDPNELYPRKDLLGQPDINRLARPEFHTQHESYVFISENLLEEVSLANSTETWSEPLGYSTCAYGYNQVIETIGGHVLELDSTQDQERILLYHPIGNYIEFQPNGNYVQKLQGDVYLISNSNVHEYIQEDYNLTLEKTHRIKIGNDYEIEVVDGNMNIQVKNGNGEITINGDLNMTVNGNVTQKVSGDMSTDVDGVIDLESNGRINIRSGSSVNIRGSSINLN